MLANKLVFSKIITFAHYGADFKAAVQSQLNANTNLAGFSSSTPVGDIFQYINWNTPKIYDNGGVENGVYAGGGTWHNGVRAIYEKYAYAGAAAEFSNYLSGIGQDWAKSLAATIGCKDFPAYGFGVGGSQDPRGNTVPGEHTVIAYKL